MRARTAAARVRKVFISRQTSRAASLFYDFVYDYCTRDSWPFAGRRRRRRRGRAIAVAAAETRRDKRF